VRRRRRREEKRTRRRRSRKRRRKEGEGEGEGTARWPFIGVDLSTMLSADFATAAVLISFGVVLGVATPLQLVVMTVLEIIFFVVNEVIGRTHLGAVDAGDTIFVHIFGAYFGLTVSRSPRRGLSTALTPPSAGCWPDRTSATATRRGLPTTATFSPWCTLLAGRRTRSLQVGTVFLWMFWPSFNAGAAAEGDAQMRAVVNTYYR
jgi:ammonium transporter Rh